MKRLELTKNSRIKLIYHLIFGLGLWNIFEEVDFVEYIVVHIGAEHTVAGHIEAAHSIGVDHIVADHMVAGHIGVARTEVVRIEVVHIVAVLRTDYVEADNFVRYFLRSCSAILPK